MFFTLLLCSVNEGLFGIFPFMFCFCSNLHSGILLLFLNSARWHCKKRREERYEKHLKRKERTYSILDARAWKAQWWSYIWAMRGSCIYIFVGIGNWRRESLREKEYMLSLANLPFAAVGFKMPRNQRGTDADADFILHYIQILPAIIVPQLPEQTCPFAKRYASPPPPEQDKNPRTFPL